MNTFGKNLRLTTFGESHGKAMGGIIDGFPSGFKIDFDEIQKALDERKPGSSTLVSARNEEDKPEFLSGLTDDGVTLGTPIAFIIRNKDHRPTDYKTMGQYYRPNHADFTYEKKYGLRAVKGGGRASARETVNWVVAGAIACQWLSKKGIMIKAILSSVGNIHDPRFESLMDAGLLNFEDFKIETRTEAKIRDKIKEVKSAGDSIGGTVSCMICGLEAGIGEPVADKFHARLSQAMMSINAAKGFEYGLGIKASGSLGSSSADIFFITDKGDVRTKTNFSGGVQGGITNGMPVYFKVHFKPTPTILLPVETIDRHGEKVMTENMGRHDPCVALRAVPVVKAMASLVVADFLL